VSERPSHPARLSLQLQRALTIAVQLGVVVLSNGLAFILRFDGDLPHRASEAFWLTLPWLVAIRAVTFIPFRLYEGLWRHASIYDLRAIVGPIRRLRCRNPQRAGGGRSRTGRAGGFATSPPSRSSPDPPGQP